MKLDNILNESRAWRRVEVDLAAEGDVLSSPGKVFTGRVVNIHPDGACFTASTELKAGDVLSLRIELPVMGKLEVRIKVVWAEYFKAAASYRVGGKFEGIDGQEKDKFLRYYHLKIMSSLGG